MLWREYCLKPPPAHCICSIMAQGMQQNLNVSLQQVLAPQLQQSLQILQVPMLELRNLIQAEIQANPVLEEEITEPSIEDRQQEQEEFKEEFERLAKLDEEWRDYMAQNNSYSGKSQEDEERRQFFFDSIISHETLQQHLMEQLNNGDLEGEDRKTAELIIGNIDDMGFLQSPLEEMSQNTGMDLADLQRVLEVIQTFHPVGVGSRDLRDCLLIQLRRIGKEQGLEYRIVEKTPRRPWQAPFPRDRPPPRHHRRAGAALRKFHRHARPQARPDLLARPE